MSESAGRLHGLHFNPLSTGRVTPSSKHFTDLTAFKKKKKSSAKFLNRLVSVNAVETVPNAETSNRLKFPDPNSTQSAAIYISQANLGEF